MSAIPIVLLGLALTLLVLSPLFARRSGGNGSESAPANPRSAIRNPQLPELEEQKARLIHALRELEDEHDTGRISADEYAELKGRYERDAVAVFRDIDASGPRAQRPAQRSGEGVTGAGWQRALAWSGVVVLFLGLAGFALISAVGPRSEGAPMTGVQLGAGDGAMAGGGGAMMGGLMSAMARTAGGGDTTALAALAARLAADSSDLEALVRAGHLYLATQRFSEAAHVSMQALEIDHGNLEAYSHIALLFLLQGRSDMAAEILQQVLAVRPDDPEALLYLGTVRLATGGDPTAAWERFLASVPPEWDVARIQNMLAAVKARQN